MGSIPSQLRHQALLEEVPRRVDDRAFETAGLLIAALSILAGVIHVGVVAGDVQRSSSYTPLVAMIAVFQLGWGALALLRPSRGALIWGLSGSAALAALWVVSRTVGVPVGPEPWVAEPVGAVDVIAAVAEIAIAACATCVLLASSSARARRAVPRLAAVLLSVMFISVTYGVETGGHIGGSIWLCC